MGAYTHQVLEEVVCGVFNILSLYPEQLNVLDRLNIVNFRLYLVTPAHVLFIQYTSSGEYLVRDVHSVVFWSVWLTIGSCSIDWC